MAIDGEDVDGFHRSVGKRSSTGRASYPAPARRVVRLREAGVKTSGAHPGRRRPLEQRR
jgi:hypothetical protein